MDAQTTAPVTWGAIAGGLLTDLAVAGLLWAVLSAYVGLTNYWVCVAVVFLFNFLMKEVKGALGN